jgi:3-hydroxyacyl-CoA dehydrogenase
MPENGFSFPNNCQLFYDQKNQEGSGHRLGVMGGGIAALLASAGVKTLLLDIVPFDLKDEEKNDPVARNRIAKAGLDTVLMSRPALLMQPKDADLISIGNLEDDFDKLAECDWIVEVVVENLKIKQELLKRIEPVRKTGCRRFFQHLRHSAEEP